MVLLFFGTFLASIVADSRFLSVSHKLLQEWYAKTPHLDIKTKRELTEASLQRIHTYQNFIKTNHLVNGMVVNRGLFNIPTDVCDSLLFSSLRFIALEKLGFKEDAARAWEDIMRTKQNGAFWPRHPLCRTETLSRDMFLGIVSALTQKPPGYFQYLEEIAQRLNTHSGFFDKGPVYTSFVTPSLKFSLDRMLAFVGIAQTQFFGTDVWIFEWETLFVKPGYEAHLTALHLWLNGEIHSLYEKKHMTMSSPSNLALKLFKFLNWFTLESLDEQKTLWVAFKIYSESQPNLFFKWLFLKELGLVNETARFALLRELLDMREFPKERLPWDCDRKADYLWQRRTEEYLASLLCREEFHGGDFLWMTALLLEPELGTRQK